VSSNLPTYRIVWVETWRGDRAVASDKRNPERYGTHRSTVIMVVPWVRDFHKVAGVENLEICLFGVYVSLTG
jgi:hypothetical protein